MRTKEFYWGCNNDPINLLGLIITPTRTKPIKEAKNSKSVLKVVDHFMRANIITCNNCNKELLDPEQMTSLKSHMCIECYDFDLCEDCFVNISHPHPMLAYYGPPIERFTGTTVQECLLHSFKIHAGLPMAGIRDGKNFKWYTYDEVYNRTKRFAAGLRTINNITGKFVSICAPNSLEYVIADYGVILCGLTTVPIHVPFGQNEIDYIIQSTETSCVICSVSVIQKFLNSAGKKVNECLKAIIQIESSSITPPEIIEQAKHLNIRLLYFEDVSNKGDVETFIPTPTDPKDLFSITFTSGSTGTPKGVMHSNESVVHEIMLPFSAYYIGMCIGPYAHSSRQNMMHTFCSGGRVGIASGDMESLVEEIQMVNPTGVNAVPRFWNMLYSQYKTELAMLEKSDPENAAIAPALIADRFQTMLGRNVKALISGGAPIGEQVLEFLRTCFDVPVVDGYASTEAGSMVTNGEIDSDIELKLENWGEYTTDDKPYPRGEICVKTKHFAMGYWKDEKTTTEMFVDGWFHTGDIGEKTGRNTVRIIDRKKNLFKMSQGEFVAPEPVENILLESKFVKQIFVTGNTTQSFLVAVVVPERDAIVDWALQNGYTNISLVSIESIFSDAKLIAAIQADFLDIGTKAQLPPFQIPRAVYLCNKSFTAQNGLLTASNKINRISLEKEFKQIVNSVYEKTQLLDIDLRNRTDEEILQDLIVQYAPGIESSDESIFTFGVDSISAVQIISSIKQYFKVDIKLHALYENPTKSGILEAIRTAKSNEIPASAPFKNLLERIREDAILAEDIKPSDVEAPSTPTNIFLTGATGFLGAYLLIELLKQTTANIHCLVRAENEESATTKLLKNLAFYKINFDAFRPRIITVVGDLSKPLFGLDPTIYDTLCQIIDSIYHCGAMVNSIWPYDAHKAHNVDGTLEIIKLACKHRYKHLHHISTLSVFRDTSVDEDTDAHQLGLSLLTGYGQSKWAAERLCVQARKRGLPITIYRFGTISGDSATGRSHTSDYINRLISGIAFMGIYPSSDVKIEMTPVDYASSACVYISLQQESLGKNFHVANPEPPMRLADLANYISKFGYPVKKVRFAAWKSAISRDRNNPLFALISLFSNGVPTSEKISCQKATGAVANSQYVCPANMEELIYKYLQFFIDGNIIKMPRV